MKNLVYRATASGSLKMTVFLRAAAFQTQITLKFKPLCKAEQSSSVFISQKNALIDSLRNLFLASAVTVLCVVLLPLPQCKPLIRITRSLALLILSPSMILCFCFVEIARPCLNKFLIKKNNKTGKFCLRVSFYGFLLISLVFQLKGLSQPPPFSMSKLLIQHQGEANSLLFYCKLCSWKYV